MSAGDGPRHLQRLREQWKPKQVRLLLIGESAPDSGQAAVRFFYARH